MSPFLKRVKTVPVLLCSGTDQLSHNAKNSNNFDMMLKRQLIWWYRDNCWSPLLSNAFIRICKNRINCNRIEDFLTIAYQNGNALKKWHWIHLHRVHKFTTPCHENSATHVIHLSFLVGLQKFVSGKNNIMFSYAFGLLIFENMYLWFRVLKHLVVRTSLIWYSDTNQAIRHYSVRQWQILVSARG